LITLVAGDLLAGEATAGTYRILGNKACFRMQIVTSKFLSGYDLYKFFDFIPGGMSLVIG